MADGSAHHRKEPSVRQADDTGLFRNLPLPGEIRLITLYGRGVESLFTGIEEGDADVPDFGVFVDVLILPEFYARYAFAVIARAAGQIAPVLAEAQRSLPHTPDGRQGRVFRIGLETDGERNGFRLAPGGAGIVGIAAAHDALEVFFHRGLLVPQQVETPAAADHRLLPGRYGLGVVQRGRTGQHHRIGPASAPVSTFGENHPFIVCGLEGTLRPESVQEAAGRVFQHVEMVVETIARLAGHKDRKVVREHVDIRFRIKVMPVEMTGPALPEVVRFGKMLGQRFIGRGVAMARLGHTHKHRPLALVGGILPRETHPHHRSLFGRESRIQGENRGKGRGIVADGGLRKELR